MGKTNHHIFRAAERAALARQLRAAAPLRALSEIAIEISTAIRPRIKPPSKSTISRWLTGKAVPGACGRRAVPAYERTRRKIVRLAAPGTAFDWSGFDAREFARPDLVIYVDARVYPVRVETHVDPEAAGRGRRRVTSLDALDHRSWSHVDVVDVSDRMQRWDDDDRQRQETDAEDVLARDDGRRCSFQG